MQFNRVIIGGFLAADPEARFTQSGTAVTQFTVAVNESYKGKDGNRSESVSFIRVTAFGKQAEVIAKYLKKGKPILVEGRLKQERYKSKDGKDVNTIKVMLDSFSFVSSGGGKAADAPASAEASEPAGGTPEPAADGSTDDQVPF